MKTSHKAVALVKSFKDAGYRVEAHYMHLPRQEAAKRAVGRFLGKTKRFVPPEVVLSNTGNESSFDAIKPHVDAWSFRDNNVAMGQDPKLISERVDEADRGKSGRHGLSAPAAGGGGIHPRTPGGKGGGWPPGGAGFYGPAREAFKKALDDGGMILSL